VNEADTLILKEIEKTSGEIQTTVSAMVTLRVVSEKPATSELPDLIHHLGLGCFALVCYRDFLVTVCTAFPLWNIHGDNLADLK
jgi:hypothetical protein